jgi:outer membrane protein
VALAFATPVSSETLADALADAYRNSNLLEQNRAVLRAADEDVAQSVATLRPVIAFLASGTYADPALTDNLTGTAALTAEITLWAGGANRLGIEAARETVLATRQALLQVEQAVLLTGVQAYMDVVSAAEFVDLREANVRLITRELSAAQDRFEVGEVTRTDVSIAEARLAASRAALSVAQGDLEVAKASFRVAIGRAPGAMSGAGRAPANPGTLEEAIAIAVRGHPAIRQSQHEVQASELASEITKARTRGTLTGSARMSVDEEGDDSSSLGLSFRQPIYQGGALNSAFRQAVARRDAARASLLQSARLVEQDVRNAWALLQVANAQINSSQQQIRASQVAFDGVQEEAKLGARTTLDVLNAEQELLDARTARVDAGVQQVVAVYSLLSAMGLLTVEHLQLGVPTYDPELYYNAVRNAPAASVQGAQLDRILESIGR